MSDFDFANSVSVVTGAGRGIGLAIAKKLAHGGSRVAVISRTDANAQNAANEINAEFPDAAKPYAVDVADFSAVQELGKRIVEDFGAVDILVNNAGVTRDGLLLRMTEEDWDIVLNTNLKGAFNMVKALQRSILKSPRGRIINISSVIGLTGNAGQANYAASKAGLIGFTKALAREYAKRKICVNAVAPGFIVTDMTDELTEEQKASVLETIPMRQLGCVDDIAACVGFLAGPGAAYITGQVFTVDGGMVM